MICWHSQSLPLLLLLMLTIHQGLSDQLACNYSTIVDSIIDVKAALAKGMKSLDLIHKQSKEECLEECCSGPSIRIRIAKFPCNFVTFHPANNSHANCYLFYCSEKDACPMINLTGYNSYIIENDQRNVEIVNTATKNSHSREKSLTNGIPVDMKTSAPGLTLSRRTINALPLTTIHSRIKQRMTATTFKAPTVLLSTFSTKTTSSITQLPVKTTSSVTTKESTATSTLQNGLLLTSAKTVPTTVFPMIRLTQTRMAALPKVPSVTSMLTGTTLTTTTQEITTIATKPLATTTLQTTSAFQPTMITAPPSTLQTTSTQSMTTTILTTTNQTTTTTLPITTDQPTTTTDQPTATTLPITTDQPTTTNLRITTDQHTTTTLPITTDQPTTTNLRITTDQHTTTTLPITTDQPTTTNLPITTDQPTTTTLPITTDQPTTTPLPTSTLATTTLPTTTNQRTTTTTLPTTLQTTPIPTTMITTFPTTTAQPAMRTTLLIRQTSTTIPPTSLQTSAAQLKTALPETRPMTTITTVSARKLNPTVTQQPTESRNSAAKTLFFRIITAVSNSGDTNKRDDEEKDPRQNFRGQNESAGKFGDSQMEIKGGLITALLFGLLFLTIVIVVLSKQVIESYRRRHYTKMDFVMNGIYVDA